MKSNFLKLGSMLLCGAMFATVACTDFSEDMNQMAGDVDALEVTLGDLQDKLTELETAQSALEDLVALKADAKDLEKAVADLQGDVKKVSDALANYATVDQLNKAVADATAQVTEVVAGLQSQIDALKTASDTHATKDELAAAKAELTKKIADDLAAAKADLEKSIAAVETAAKAYTDALANGAVKENTEAIAKLDEAVKALQGDVKTLQGTVEELGERIEAAEGKIKTLEETTIPALQKAIKDVEDELANYVTKDALNEQLKNYASAETVNKVKNSLEIVEQTLAGVNQLLGTLVGELLEDISSLVFVPQYNDLKISGYSYNIGGKPVGTTVTVKGTYKVTPAQRADEIVNSAKYMPVMFAADLDAAATRAADHAQALSVKLSNADKTFGTFDVEAVFNAADIEVNTSAITTAVALYLLENNAVAEPADDVDDNMGVSTEPELINTAISSSYVPVGWGAADLADMYRLVKDGKLYAAKEDKFGWDVVETTTPLEGYEVMLALDPAKPTVYTSLADAALMFNVRESDITPYYSDVVKFYRNGAPESNCAVQVVTPKEATKANDKTIVVRTYSVKDAPIKLADADKYVGHKVVTTGEFYMYNASDVKTVVIPDVDYSYEITNRKIVLDLEDAYVDWTYDVAVALSNGPSQPYYNSIGFDTDNDLFESFKEVSIEVVEGTIPGDYNIKTIINDGLNLTETWFNGQKQASATGFDVAVTAYQDAQIAKVAVAPAYYYHGGEWQNNVALKNVYNVAADYTDIEVNFELGLGALPKPAVYDFGTLTLPLSSAGYIVKDLELGADKLSPTEKFFEDVKADFEDYATFAADLLSSATVVTNFKDYTTPQKNWEGNSVVRKNPTTPATYDAFAAEGTTYVEVSATDGEYVRLSTNAHLQNIADLFMFDKTFDAWYGVSYQIKGNAQVQRPAYSLAPVELWVKEGNVVDVPGHTEAGVWVINDAKLNTYVQIVGEVSTDDALYIKWETVTEDDATSGEDLGIANVPNPTLDYSAYTLSNNSIAESKIVWNNYTARELQVKATLYMKKFAPLGVTASNLVQVGEPIELNLVTKDMIRVSAENFVVERNGQPEITVNFLKGLVVNGLDVQELPNTCIDGQYVDGEWEYNNFIVNTDSWASTPFSNASQLKYGLDFSIDPVVTVAVNDIPTTTVSGMNYSYDHLTDKLVFRSNEAVLQTPISFTAKVTVTYNRDYNHKQAQTKEIKITIVENL